MNKAAQLFHQVIDETRYAEYESDDTESGVLGVLVAGDKREKRLLISDMFDISLGYCDIWGIKMKKSRIFRAKSYIPYIDAW